MEWEKSRFEGKREGKVIDKPEKLYLKEQKLQTLKVMR